MLKQDEHDGFRGWGHRSIIPYTHGCESFIAVCVELFKAELNLHRVEVQRTCLLLSFAWPFIAQGRTVTL
jgi:hypothetical protein